MGQEKTENIWNLFLQDPEFHSAQVPFVQGQREWREAGTNLWGLLVWKGALSKFRLKHFSSKFFSLGTEANPSAFCLWPRGWSGNDYDKSPNRSAQQKILGEKPCPEMAAQGIQLSFFHKYQVHYARKEIKEWKTEWDFISSKVYGCFPGQSQFCKIGTAWERGARSIPPLTATCSPGGR